MAQPPRRGAARSRARLMAIVALALLNVLGVEASRTRSPGCFPPAWRNGKSRW